MDLSERSELLLETWCKALQTLQIKDMGNPHLDGAILCPSCGKIHGRCFDAMYPFLHQAQRSSEKSWVASAMALFDWAEETLSLSNGAYLNDIDSEWIGTTVFSTIQLADCMLHYDHLIPPSYKQRISNRIRKAADFLYDYESLIWNNVNYPISNALALYRCGTLFGEERYSEKAKKFAAVAKTVITEHGLIFGEGVPRTRLSKKGCVSVDIGYNVEETLPALALYGALSGDEESSQLAKDSLFAHLSFMLEDGGWDNSFGTRNFKWTYWGSRTSDGCLPGYLVYARDCTEFASAAVRNFALLESCTHNGLLCGGPHYVQAGQSICVHHTFEHAKMLSLVQDLSLFSGIVEQKAQLPRTTREGLHYFGELASWILTRQKFTATVTGYDWEYLPGGHVSGGSLSLYYHTAAGLLLCAGMGKYVLKERNNMQVPTPSTLHECLALRLEVNQDGDSFSSIYDDEAAISWEGDCCTVRGVLRNINHHALEGGRGQYLMHYNFTNEKLVISSHCPIATLICPIISEVAEQVSTTAHSLTIVKHTAFIQLSVSGNYVLPYGQERIFNLIPGFQALRIDLPATNEARVIELSVK